jgi:hypothetical protein
MTKEDAAAGGILTATVEATVYQETSSALGVVLPSSTFAEARHASQAAAAAVEQQEFAVKAARLEVQRLRPLNRQDRIVSDKALESAQGAVLTEEANLRLATSQVRLLALNLREQWGPTLGDWLVRGSPQLEALLSGQNRVVQIVLPMGKAPSEKMSAHIDVGGDTLEAAVISDSQKVDPRFHGYSIFAIAGAAPTLRPGMNVPVVLTFGESEKGFGVPDSAVVHWQGTPWVFVDLGDGEFVRKSLDSPKATPNGWFIESGFSSNSHIAVRGAQLLLSEELKASDSSDNQ